jgi:hypothetical protein
LNSLAFFRGRLGAKAPSYQHPAPSEEQEQGQKKKQIPPLGCGMTNKKRGKDKYRDSGCARMTTLYVRQNDGQRETNND